MAPLRFVSWAAVSSLPQAKKISLSDQLRENKEHIEKWKGLLVEELVVPGVSRSIVLFEDAARKIEAYARLKELIDRRAFDVLIYLDATRLGRKDSLISAVAALCEQAGIRLYETSSPPLTLDGPIGTFDYKLLNAFKGVMSEHEIQRFVERSIMGREARIKAGKHAGNLPFGYKRIYDELGRESVVIDPEQAEIVHLFYDLLFNQGLSMLSICAEFNRRGYRTRRSNKPWTVGTVRQFLKNAWAYAGYTTWGKGDKQMRLKAEWEPILDEEKARMADERLERHQHAPRAGSNPYRLSMVVRCSYCGSTVTVHARAGKWHYVTNRMACVKHCRGARCGEPEILETIRQAIRSLNDDALLESLVDVAPNNYKQLITRYDQANDALEKVGQERKRLTLAFTRDVIRLEEYEELMADLQCRHDSLALTVSELREKIAATPTAENRRSRLQEIRDQGLKMVDHPDRRTANAWLRRHIAVYLRDYKVVAVDFL